jgi:thiol-disulfide isomerase/thioredoxin
MRQSLKLIIVFLVMALWSIHGLTSIAASAPPPDKLLIHSPPLPLPEQSYLKETGEEARIKDHIGKVIILNFWATWCAPCVRELPHLDSLKAVLPADRFLVLALSTDARGKEKAAPFLKKLGIKHLRADLDPRSKLARQLGTRGMPTTFIFNTSGQIIASLEGFAEWDSPSFIAWFKSLLKD